MEGVLEVSSANYLYLNLLYRIRSKFDGSIGSDRSFGDPRVNDNVKILNITIHICLFTIILPKFRLFSERNITFLICKSYVFFLLKLVTFFAFSPDLLPLPS